MLAAVEVVLTHPELLELVVLAAAVLVAQTRCPELRERRTLAAAVVAAVKVPLQIAAAMAALALLFCLSRL
jgi:hypothetical protein